MADAQPSRLSQISTRWTVFLQAHGDSDEEAKAARRELLQQYGSPVYRYLRAAARDADAADELYQEFALKFVRGDLRRADPDRGRFRDFLKTTLYHLVVDHQRRIRKQPQSLVEVDLVASPPRSNVGEGEFHRSWRNRLLEQAFLGLQRYEQESGQPLYTVLRLRTDYPDLTAEQLAVRLETPLGKPVDAGWVRKRLHYARERFAALLVDAVRRTLDEPNRNELEEELIDLELWEYCQDALPKGPDAIAAEP